MNIRWFMVHRIVLQRAVHVMCSASWRKQRRCSDVLSRGESRASRVSIIQRHSTRVVVIFCDDKSGQGMIRDVLSSLLSPPHSLYTEHIHGLKNVDKKHDKYTCTREKLKVFKVHFFTCERPKHYISTPLPGN